MSKLTRAADLLERPSNTTPAEHYRSVVNARDAAYAQARDLEETAKGRDLRASEQRAWNEALAETERLGQLADTLSEHYQITAMEAGQIMAGGDLRRDPGLPFPGMVANRNGIDPRTPILTKDQRFADWPSAKSRRGEEPGGEQMRLGAMLRAWVTGRREDLNDAEIRAAMSEGVSTAGGVLVPTPLAANLIDRARNAARVVQAGAVTVPMDSQTLKIPRLTGSSAPAWRNENAAVAEGDLTLDSVTLTARSLAFLVKMSRELFEDSDPSAADMVERDLAAQVALEFDRVALRGTGTAPEPRGVLNTTGVTITTHGANGALISDATMKYLFLIDAVGAVRGNNHEPNAQIVAPRTETGLAKLVDTTGQHIAPPAMLADIPRLTTKQVPTNLTVGTSTDCSEVYTGQWNQLLLGLRTGPIMFTLVERYADAGQVAIMVWFRGDIAVAQPAAFAVDTGVRS